MNADAFNFDSVADEKLEYGSQQPARGEEWIISNPSGDPFQVRVIDVNDNYAHVQLLESIWVVGVSIVQYKAGDVIDVLPEKFRDGERIE